MKEAIQPSYAFNPQPSVLEPVDKDRSRVARALSNLLSPPLIALWAFWLLAGRYAGSNRWQALGVCALGQSVLPVLFLKWSVWRGWIGDVDMTRRGERKLGLPLLGLVYLAGSLAAYFARVPGAMMIVVIGSLAVLALVWLVNLRYKASGHMAGTTAYMTALSLLHEPVHPGLWVIPVLAWARVRSGAHTVAQTIWGFSMGAVTTWLLYTHVYLRWLQS